MTGIECHGIDNKLAVYDHVIELGYKISFHRCEKAFELSQALLNSVGKGGWDHALVITGVRSNSYKKNQFLKTGMEVKMKDFPIDLGYT